jgi:hypothetical protein
VDGRTPWIGWIIVVVIGLSPILTVWIALSIGRFLRRKLWPTPERDTLVGTDRSGSARKDEDRRADRVS